MKICRQVIYAGRVQGVGFRYSVKQLATGFDVTGWVRNLPDGTVEMQATGDGGEVDAFETAITNSHLAGYIRHAQRNDLDPTETTGTGFEIRH